jgi:hypothetical protein
VITERRLRDLQGRDRLLAVGLVVLVLVPFAVALLRAFGDGWIPSGDEANIATRALDVFSRHPPLTGLPSTSDLYGSKIHTNHPGPIEFYLLAVPVRVLGMSAGPLLTAAVINAAFVLISLWVFFRRLGLTATLWAGVLLLAMMWSGGTAVLTDTLSSNMTMYSLLGVTVLAWALIDGDVRLLPLAAFVASYAAQQHLAAGLIVFVLLAVATVALATSVVRQARRANPTVKQVAFRWSLLAGAVAVVCWAPAVVDQVHGHPGNLSEIVRFARDDSRATLGLESGFYQAVHAITPPTILGRTDTSGSFFLTDPRTVRLVLGALILGALALFGWRERVRSPGAARLALVALVLLLAGIFNGSKIPYSAEQTRVNLYRWTWTAAFVTWAALGLAVAVVVARFAGHRSVVRRAPRLGPPALLVVAALLATSIVLVHGSDDHNRELPDFALEKRVDAAVLARIDRHRPVYVTGLGTDASLSVAPQLISRLVEAGFTVEVPAFWTTTYGNERKYRPRSHPTTIVISSGRAQRPTGDGELITVQHFGPPDDPRFAALSATRSALLDRLAAAARGVKVELTPGAGALIERRFSGLQLYRINFLLFIMPKYPRTVFAEPEILWLVLQGILRAPALDPNDVRRLLELPAYEHLGLNGDEQVEVRIVKPGDASATIRQ